MMEVKNEEKYNKYLSRISEQNPKQSFLVDILIPSLIFGSIGAITWAIRGTSGWGGFDGALVPGFAWGIVWYYIMHRRGIDARSIVFWIGLGIAIGGMLGYGEYVSWIQGNYYANYPANPRSINPFVGYVWFWICGAAWGGIGSIFLSWALAKKPTLKMWLIRIIVPVLFAGLGALLVFLLPTLFYPFYPNSSTRTVDTNLISFIALMWWIGALIVCLIEKDKNSLIYGTIMGVGFGFAFAISAIWTLGYVYAPGFIDFWKIWEIFMGFYSGIILSIVLYLVQKDFDQKYKLEEEISQKVNNSLNKKSFLPEAHQKNSVMLILSYSIFLLITYYGLTSQLGVQLGLYDRSAVDQYEVPFARLVLVIPVVSIIIVWMFYTYIKLCKASKEEQFNLFNIDKIDLKMLLLGCFIYIVGVITIWPLLIWVIYTVFFIIFLTGMYLIKKYEES